MIEIHCRHCKSKTESVEAKVEQSGARYFVKALCKVCGAKKSLRVKKPEDAVEVVTSDTVEEVVQ